MYIVDIMENSMEIPEGIKNKTIIYTVKPDEYTEIKSVYRSDSYTFMILVPLFTILYIYIYKLIKWS